MYGTCTDFCTSPVIPLPPQLLRRDVFKRS
ncbi:MAG: hypothetical protein QOD67_1282, partial [Caballeronia sp.]|nr:hypothetical protein [Caballeronia sp.]